MSLLLFVLQLVCVDAFSRRGSTALVQNKVTSSTNQFAFTLYKEIGTSVPGRNVILSPLSISTALAMVYLGARGDTREEMASAMHFDVFNSTNNTVIGEEFQKLIQAFNATQKNYTLKIANRMFGEKSYRFKKQYTRETYKYFKSGLEALDFTGNSSGSRLHINNWVKRKTSGKIKDLLPIEFISSDTRLVLVNAIYFKAFWAYPFDEKYTKPAPFHLSSSKQTTVKMMNIQESFNYYNSPKLNCQVVEMGYAGGKSSMFIFVPNEIEGLSSLESRMNTDSLTKVFSNLVVWSLSISLPKFAIDHSENLKDVLEKIGMGRMFDAGRADMSGIDGSRNLYVNDAVHKAFVEVNEKGTKAAGATGFDFIPASLPKQIIVDRPFLFLIIEKSTGSVIFLGRLTVPPSN